jgi:hypothetical protein
VREPGLCFQADERERSPPLDQGRHVRAARLVDDDDPLRGLRLPLQRVEQPRELADATDRADDEVERGGRLHA